MQIAGAAASPNLLLVVLGWLDTASTQETMKFAYTNEIFTGTSGPFATRAPSAASERHPAPTRETHVLCVLDRRGSERVR